MANMTRGERRRRRGNECAELSRLMGRKERQEPKELDKRSDDSRELSSNTTASLEEHGSAHRRGNDIL